MKACSKKKWTAKKVFVIMAIAAVVVGIVFASIVYVNDFYKASGIAKEALQGSELVQVTEQPGYYEFCSKEGKFKKGKSKGGIIFYPGGKVDEVAYAPLMERFAECGYDVYLMRLTAHLAVLEPDAADEVLDDSKEWTIMGHSLGGAMAAKYAAEHDDRIQNLVLLGAYSTTDLSDTDISVLSMYGSDDGVMNRESYKKYWKNLPKDTCEQIIDGGNHAGYGFYGEQKGDLPAEITPDEQQEAVVDAFLYCME